MGALSKARSGAPTKQQTPQQYVEGLLRAVGQTMKETAPRGTDVTRLQGQFVHACMTTPRLLECSPESLQVAAVDLATHGLELGEEVYLVPRRNRGQWQAQAQVGYRGILAKLYRSPKVKVARCGVFHENDSHFHVDEGQGIVEHTPCLRGDPGEAVGYWASVQMEGEVSVVKYMSREQVERHRDQYSKGHDRADSSWQSAFDAMAMKTVIVQAARTVPRSRELQGVLDVEYQRNRPSLRALGAGHLAESFTPDAEVVADGPLMVPFGPDEGTPVSEVSTDGLNWLGEQLFEKLKTSKGKEREQQQMLSDAVSAELSRRGQ